MANLILLRHGSTKLNKGAGGESAERIRGHVDIPLDEKGRREAVALGAKWGSEPIAKIYTSDLSRAADVAKQIKSAASSKGQHVPAVATDRLRPWDLGILHGKEVEKVLPLMNKCVEHPSIIIPNGESFDSYRTRYLPMLDEMLQEAAHSPKDIIAVTHSRNLQLARAWDKAGRPKDYSYDLERMMDYKDEVPPGGELKLQPGNKKETLGQPPK